MNERDVLLVVVGAGASHACLGSGSGVIKVDGLPPVNPESARPPLTQALVGPGHLQDQILARYPAAKPLVASLRRVLTPSDSQHHVTASFEQLLDDYDATARSNPARLRHLTAMRFYLRDLLWACTEFAAHPSIGGGITAHHQLVNELQHWAHQRGRHVCFVNFNYDLILENACADAFGFDPHDLDSYTANPDVSVVKPHGSINWVWPTSNKSMFGSRRLADETVIQESADGFLVDARGLFVIPEPPHRSSHRGYAHAVPALALPLATKHDFVWPKAQRAFVEGFATRVRGIVTLGWRAVEPHFLGLLPPMVREQSRIVVVTGGPDARADAQGVEDRLHDAIGRAPVEVVPHTDGLPWSLRDHLKWLDGAFDA